MLRIVKVVNCCCSLSVLCSAISSASVGQAIRAEVHGPMAVYSTTDPDLATIKLRFNVRLANDSPNEVYLPRSSTNSAGASAIVVGSLESQGATGEWTYIVRPGVIVAADGVKYSPCRSLRPGESAEIADVAGTLYLLSSQLPGPRRAPTVRLGLRMSCQQADGQVVSTTVVTAPFSLKLSD
jgi:hypothetical protein